jgi:hypothetical protein
MDEAITACLVVLPGKRATGNLEAAAEPGLTERTAGTVCSQISDFYAGEDACW